MRVQPGPDVLPPTVTPGRISARAAPSASTTASAAYRCCHSKGHGGFPVRSIRSNASRRALARSSSLPRPPVLRRLTSHWPTATPSMDASIASPAPTAPTSPSPRSIDDLRARLDQDRPPARLPHHPLKIKQIGEYGYCDTNTADCKEHHLVPLELGGAPRDPKNLWPEPRYRNHPAASEDAVEYKLKTAVCSGTVKLDAARSASPPTGPQPCPRSQSADQPGPARPALGAGGRLLPPLAQDALRRAAHLLSSDTRWGF